MNAGQSGKEKNAQLTPENAAPVRGNKGRNLTVLGNTIGQGAARAAGGLKKTTGQAFLKVEEYTKGALFDCHMCGQCILQQTALICPMRCPKGMRNGPCGGPSLDGKCEVYPEMLCIWVEI